MSKLLTVIPIVVSILLCSSASWAQVYSDNDSARVVATAGHAGDTISVPIDVFNTFRVGGFQFRITFDSACFIPTGMELTSRSLTLEIFGSNFTEAGVASIFATSSYPADNAIPPGDGDMAHILFAINGNSTPGLYPFRFENSGPGNYENALSNSIGDSLIIPVLVNGQIEIQPAAGIVNQASVPSEFAVSQNYPNPFNGSTVISFSLAKPAFVELAVFDLLGKEVAALYTGMADAGNTSVSWDGRNGRGENVASGIYYYRLESAGGNVVTRKMSLLK